MLFSTKIAELAFTRLFITDDIGCLNIKPTAVLFLADEINLASLKLSDGHIVTHAEQMLVDDVLLCSENNSGFAEITWHSEKLK